MYFKLSVIRILSKWVMMTLKKIEERKKENDKENCVRKKMKINC